MKRIVLILLIIVSNSTSAQTVDSLFNKANKLYQNEKYNQALELYKKIEEQHINSDKLYYNIANANYKLNRIAPAIYYYEKALLVNPTNNDAKFNLEFAKGMALDNIEPLPKTFLEKLRESIILRLKYNTWAWAAVVLSFMFGLLFLLYYFAYQTKRKRLYFTTSIISIFLASLSVLFAYQNYSFVTNTKEAIVFAQQADVKSAPTMSSSVNFELHEGAKVQLLESLDDWQKIKIADGKTGWMLADDIKQLN